MNIVEKIEREYLARFEGKRKVRKEALLGLGGACEGCGCTDLLELRIHHRNNDGKDHRWKMSLVEGLRSKGYGICRWAKSVGYVEALKWVGVFCDPCHKRLHSKRGPKIPYLGPMPRAKRQSRRREGARVDDRTFSVLRALSDEDLSYRNAVAANEAERRSLDTYHLRAVAAIKTPPSRPLEARGRVSGLSKHRFNNSESSLLPIPRPRLLGGL